MNVKNSLLLNVISKNVMVIIPEVLATPGAGLVASVTSFPTLFAALAVRASGLALPLTGLT